MKKILSTILAASMLVTCFAGCAKTGGNTDRIKIVTTIFPIYDWVSNIAGHNPADAEIDLLMSSGTDMHSFQPTVQDIMTISDCDLFIYVGGESDEWVDGALEEAVNKDMVVVNLMDVLGDRALQEDDEPENDEHIWLSLRNADICCEAIENALINIDPDHVDTYRVNATTYRGKLTDLDFAYESVVEECSKNTLLFADRFPFRYLMHDYGIEHFEAFEGCSAETEASFETVIFLAGKVDECGLGYVLKIDGSNDRIPQSIIDNTASRDQQILTLDSMQSVTSADIEAGTTYLSVMESNLEVIRTALS